MGKKFAIIMTKWQIGRFRREESCINSISTISFNGRLKDNPVPQSQGLDTSHEEAKREHKLQNKSCSSNDRDRSSNYKPASRSNYSSTVTEILQGWFEAHIDYPYPSEQERIELCAKTGLSRKQLRVWLINSRKRKAPKVIKKVGSKDTHSDFSIMTPKDKIFDFVHCQNQNDSNVRILSKSKPNVFELIQNYNSRTIQFYQKKMQETCDKKLNSFCMALNKYCFCEHIDFSFESLSMTRTDS
ncbi:unnamed protein product [Moneuplotes crassus]|uniref:Homeobox domain-containing protein n=1 Tax=Euplotes crassus TaxID=5936 RepID=A0AAD1U573_EUPCR|nr:unnamed protein product [Moneuplotes crassus]